ncbi:MAG TPA: peptidase M3, partial [Paracoccaceae bacterium]|nr:peptidase M3 [Paracoccaceae bacterium]
MSDWTTPFELPPFDRINPDHFAPAFDEGFAQARGALAKIADNPEPPTFANTVEAMERAEVLLDKVAGVF